MKPESFRLLRHPEERQRRGDLGRGRSSSSHREIPRSLRLPQDDISLVSERRASARAFIVQPYPHPPLVRRGTLARFTSAPKVWLRPTWRSGPWPCDFFCWTGPVPRMPSRLAGAGLFRLSLSWRKLDDSLPSTAPPVGPDEPSKLRFPTIAAAADAARLVSMRGRVGAAAAGLDDFEAGADFFAPDFAVAAGAAAEAAGAAAGAAFFAAGAFFGAGAAGSLAFAAAVSLSVVSFFAFAMRSSLLPVRPDCSGRRRGGNGRRRGFRQFVLALP